MSTKQRRNDKRAIFAGLTGSHLRMVPSAPPLTRKAGDQATDSTRAAENKPNVRFSNAAVKINERTVVLHERFHVNGSLCGIRNVKQAHAAVLAARRKQSRLRSSSCRHVSIRVVIAAGSGSNGDRRGGGRVRRGCAGRARRSSSGGIHIRSEHRAPNRTAVRIRRKLHNSVINQPGITTSHDTAYLWNKLLEIPFNDSRIQSSRKQAGQAQRERDFTERARLTAQSRRFRAPTVEIAQSTRQSRGSSASQQTNSMKFRRQFERMYPLAEPSRARVPDFNVAVLARQSQPAAVSVERERSDRAGGVFQKTGAVHAEFVASGSRCRRRGSCFARRCRSARRFAGRGDLLFF